MHSVRPNIKHLQRITTTDLLLRTFASLSPPTNSVSLYLQRSKFIDSIRLALRSASPTTSLLPLLSDPALDSFVLTHSLRSAPSPDSALSLLQTLQTLNPNSTLSYTQPTLLALAKILAKSRRTTQLHSLIHDINAQKFTNVARVGFMDLLRWNAIAGDLQSALQVWNSYKLALPRGKKHPCTESYNILLGLYAKNGRNLEAAEMFGRMMDEGANPNSRTFTVVIDHLVSNGKLVEAQEVFDVLPAMRIKRTVKQYAVLVEGFTSIRRFDLVSKLVREMHLDGMLPNESMRMSIKCLQDAGFGDVEEFIGVSTPDKRIESIGYSVDESSEEDNDEDVDDNLVGGDRVQLKPWLDPSALASALSDWNPGDVLALEKAKFVWTSRLVCKMLRSFKRAETAWKFFQWVAYQPGDFTHDVYTISRMIAILARHGQVEFVDQLLLKVKRERIRLSFSTMRLIIDFYGLAKEPDAALRVFYDIESVSGPMSKSHLILLYSSLFRTLVKCRRGLIAMDILDEMMLSGLVPDIQTLTGLMQYFALEGDLRTVQKLFGMVRQSGIEPDAYMFRILIRAYCKRGRAALGLRVFEDMRNSNLYPDSATKALLVNSLWKEGKLREAAFVEEISEEINHKLPVAIPGHVWTVSEADLRRVCDIYFNSFASNDGYRGQ